ncbi:sodium:solute symporter [Aquimarina sp. MMG015]|uniref:sodium:solute symporter n=1 Tax=Aquimarina TaxID=290174 RepID=UPI0003FCEE6E|nr:MULTISPECIES: sodium:solute symporter [Aquimarina]AXT57821.1 sodium transporter [Aquimarina sp. AD1]MBQ4803239.1 sodium:solute symporter [Aquimarina sp. MMG015]RKN35020.1 sodium transporter [Aquimarina sp. AD1]
MNELSYIDITVIVVYLIGIIIYGISKSKRGSSEDYFLGGRTMTWPIVGIALFSANISSSTLVGLASDAYQTNINVYNYEWYAVVVLIFFAIFFLPFYLRSGVYTMPEFLERRYDKRSRYYFSFITVVGNILVDTAAGLYVGKIVLTLLFPSMDSTLILVILAVAAAAYTIPGGLNSVIQTEVIQAILLIIGSCLLTYFAFDQLGGGWSGMMAKLDTMLSAGDVNFGNRLDEGKYIPANADEVFSLVRPSNDEFMPWWGLLTGVPLLGFYFWANNQFMVQRVLGAKDLNHGRWGALFAGFLKLPVIFIMVVPGVLALLLFSTLDITSLNYTLTDGTICNNLSDCPNLTYPVLLFQLLPVGVLGLVVAGLMAAMMSSVSATFNSASTLVTMDFVKQLKPELTSKQLVRVGQITTVILVVLAISWVPFIESVSDSLWTYLQLVIAYTCPPAVSTFVLGLFWKRANGNGSIVSLLTGFSLAVFMILSQTFDWIPVINELHFLAKATWLFVICVILHMIVSLMTRAQSEEQIKEYTYKKEMFKEESKELIGLPWYKNYRILSVILLVITALVVGFFW